MAATQTLSEPTSAQTASTPGLLISLGPLSPEGLTGTLANLALAFPGETILVTTPDPAPPSASEYPQLHITSYTPAAQTPGTWSLTAADFLNTWKLMQENKATACLLLGAEAETLRPEALHALAGSARGTSGTPATDLTTPRYELSPHGGLVNSAILYPVTRALFGARQRYPLAIDLALSSRMAERLATAAQKFTAANQNAAIVWPVSEAAFAGFTTAEISAGSRTLPSPDNLDLNTLLAQVAGSFFTDIDSKAGFWQRSRLAYSPKAAQARTEAAPLQAQAAQPDDSALTDIKPMLDSFRLAYTNLHEIWSLVLPPNSLLGLKRLSLMPPDAFRMPDTLWARIVFDFILAYRLRTINRGHLLGALTPLYLAWVASHLLLTRNTLEAGVETMPPEKHIETLAAAFEADKPYLVSRWRWPDRFNP